MTEQRSMNLEMVQEGARLMLQGFGLDLDDQHLKETPTRVARAWVEHLVSGYAQDPEEVLKKGFDEQEYDQMVVVGGIPFYSVCSHHMLPFMGKVSVGYLPKGRILGLSKVVRLVRVFAHRLQVQERMSEEIAEALEKHLEPLGVGVVVSASHMCMKLRGVRSPNWVTTSSLKGKFLSEPHVKDEFLRLVELKMQEGD